MAKELKRNVSVGGTWYGPAWPQNKVTDVVAKALEGNDLVYADPAPADAAGTAFGPRLDDGKGAPAGDPGAPLGGDDRAQLEQLSKDELLALAEARQVDVAKSSTKAEIVDALTGKA